MPATKREMLHGWGYTPVRECISYRPEKRRDLPPILEAHAAPLLARGLGRSYGDAALQPSGVIRTERLDHIISFDQSTGILQAQAGLTLADVMEVAIPRGWLPPVIPGTRHVTLGGAFACNVHGKNHWREGEFAEHVIAIRLRLADNSLVECSPNERGDLFQATAGGMGMTGIIEEVTLKLRPIASASLETVTRSVDNIEHMLEAFAEYRERADYMVGWIDHMAKDEELGRGVFEAARHLIPEKGGAPLKSYAPMRTKFSVPFFLPPFLLNRYSMALYNLWRFHKYRARERVETVGFNGFFHPLDTIGRWNRLYGKRGFFQYQCLIPESPDTAAHLRELLAALQRRQCFSFLAVLKYHRDGAAPLAFSKRGYSVALDFPNTPRVRTLLPQIDQWVADHGGRIYLAKDALLTPDLFHHMYGQAADDWREFIRRIDPDIRFSSLMSERLAWKPKR